MQIGRRQLFASALGAAALAPLTKASAASTQTTTPPPSPDERLAARASEVRRRLSYDGRAFSGPAWDFLLSQGRAANFFMLGEEHGIAENAKMAAALFRALVPSGYSRVAIETSPQSALELDRVARSGLPGLRTYLSDQANTVAFFGMREEAEWLAAARAAVPGSQPVLWGLDYEIGADRRLIANLKAERQPPAAQRALAALEAASDAAWGRYAQTHDLSQLFSFSGDPALVSAVRAAWPRPSASAAWTIDTLQETLEINRMWVERRAWESNARRAALMRRNLLRHWHSAGARKPKLFMKFGASHMMRGRSSTEVFDLGTLVPELAEIEGGRAFQLLVLQGATSQIAQIDPATLTYRPQSGAESEYVRGLEPLYRHAYPDAFTLFDTHPLRPLMGFSRQPPSRELQRTIHGFDAILIMSGSTPSASL